jgi:hypothetical protein
MSTADVIERLRHMAEKPSRFTASELKIALEQAAELLEHPELDLVSIEEISERAVARSGKPVTKAGVKYWRSKGILPPADAELAMGPVWHWPRVAQVLEERQKSHGNGE